MAVARFNEISIPWANLNAGLSPASQVYSGPLEEQKQIFPFSLSIANFSLIGTAVLGTWSMTYCSIFPPNFVANHFTPYSKKNQAKSGILLPDVRSSEFSNNGAIQGSDQPECPRATGKMNHGVFRRQIRISQQHLPGIR
ncbi:MAG: hypothetical protein RQ739_17030, partial [Desulfotignum sp.]|nr:hypothetical protein [Desulfotignum sp.]